jgi:CBS domain containing-hemolysin-like protein
MDMFIETGHSKIIIYREDLDDIEGFVHSSSMFRKPESVKAILQPVLIVPETMSASVLLAEFTGNQRSVAIVVDEFGGTSGIITIEDLVEEVFGDIEDEYDEEEIDEDMVLVVNEDGSYLIGARQEIDDLNETLNLGLPKDDSFSTLGGLILDHTEQIPSPGDSFELDNYTVVIENSLEHRIISIKLIPK